MFCNMKKLMFKTITFIMLSGICLINLNGQTIEQQLLSQLHVTSNTSNLYNGYWTKIATCTITAQYQDFGGVFDFMGTGSGSTTIYYGRIIARFKNQNVAAAPVNFYNLLLFDSNLGAENVKAIRNGTTVSLYIRIPCNSTSIFFRQTLKAYSGPMTAYSNQPFVETLPSNDLVINCEEKFFIPGAVPDYPFHNESPVYGANIVFDATFDDANQLRNIIALRNRSTGGTSTALRQSGIHFSVAHETNNSDSQKSAQILLESSNTYANAPALNFYTKNLQRMTIIQEGRVGIGTNNPRTLLEVAGTIRAVEVKILAQTADFVFNDDYQLLPLEEVEQFIKENRHLPDIPSAAQMEEDEVIGIAEMNKLLLQKIEELTLYLIEMRKENEVLQKDLIKLQKEFVQFKN